MELLIDAENTLALGLLDSAERTYRTVLEADPRNGIAAVGLSRVALERGDEAGALALAQAALEIDPENATARRMINRLEEVARFRDAAGAPTAAASAAPPVAVTPVEAATRGAATRGAVIPPVAVTPVEAATPPGAVTPVEAATPPGAVTPLEAAPAGRADTPSTPPPTPPARPGLLRRILRRS